MLWAPGDNVAGEVSILLCAAQAHCPALGTLEPAAQVGNSALEMLTAPGTAGLLQAAGEPGRRGRVRAPVPADVHRQATGSRQLLVWTPGGKGRGTLKVPTLAYVGFKVTALGVCGHQLLRPEGYLFVLQITIFVSTSNQAHNPFR